MSKLGTGPRRKRSVSFLAVSAALLAASVSFGAERNVGRLAPITTSLFAVVDAAGNLVSGGGATGVTQLGTGQYEVTFTHVVEKCSYVATTANAYSEALTVFTAGGHLSNQGVYVETKNQGGGLTDGPFHLVVTCRGGRDTSYAVVGYAADLVRATPGTTLTPLGFGRYDVTFARRVAGCAFLATVGDPGHELVYYPSGVYTGSGSNIHTVYIETKNPGGGLQDGVPFHLAVICPGAPNTRIAVVKDDGFPVRASSLTSSFNGSTGNYAVATGIATSSCATVATRGSVDTAVPFSPTTVEIVPGPAPNTSGIQVRALLFFGGGLFNEAFHAAIICGP